MKKGTKSFDKVSFQLHPFAHSYRNVLRAVNIWFIKKLEIEKFGTWFMYGLV